MHSVRTRVSYPYVYSLSLNKDSNANEGNVDLIQYENKPADKLYWYLMTKFIINFQHVPQNVRKVMCFMLLFYRSVLYAQKANTFQEIKSTTPTKQMSVCMHDYSRN